MSQIDPQKGELAIKTIAMPANTNANGDIFGGWLVAQMDLAGSIIAIQRANARVTTVAIDKMVFHKPVHIGNTISCYGKILRVGNTSLAIKIEVWKVGLYTNEAQSVTEGIFTYVAIDKHGKSQPVDKKLG